MDAQFLSIGDPGFHFHSELSNRERNCHRAKLILAASLLVGGAVALGYGANALSNQIASASVKITANFDPTRLKAWETVSIEIDKDILKQNTIIAITGLFSTLLSAGILLGMTSCRPKRD